MKDTGILWLNGSYRIHDNPALFHVLGNSINVIPLITDYNESHTNAEFIRGFIEEFANRFFIYPVITEQSLSEYVKDPRNYTLYANVNNELSDIYDKFKSQVLFYDRRPLSTYSTDNMVIPRPIPTKCRCTFKSETFSPPVGSQTYREQTLQKINDENILSKVIELGLVSLRELHWIILIR